MSEPIPPEVLREFAAAVWLVERRAPAAIEFRLSKDRAGVLRFTMGKVEGISARELATALGAAEVGICLTCRASLAVS